MDGYHSYKPGSQTVTNCTKCYTGQGKNAIPVTSVDSHDTILTKNIYDKPSVCNKKNNWGKSRYNIIEQYNSYNELVHKEGSNGLHKLSWGPKTWDAMHAMSFGFPNLPTKDEKQQAYNFFTALSVMIPCQKCREHCKDHILTHPPKVQNRESLSQWLFDFHNSVNKRLGKKLVSWDDCKKRYLN